MLSLPRSAVALTQRQRGLIARWQLLRWLRPDQIDGHVQRATLVRVERGIYRLRGSAVLAEHRAFAAALRFRPGAVVTGPIVLGHLGVDGFTGRDPFELLLPGHRRVRATSVRWRPDPRPDREVVHRGAIRLATPADALVHATRWRAELGDRRLRLGCHWLGWRGVLDRDRFHSQLVARAGVDDDARTLLEILGGVVLGRCESDEERRLGRILCRFDPAPEPQVWLRVTRRTDFYFRLLRFAVEYDGRLDHDGEAAGAADRARDAELATQGIEVLHLGPADLRDEAALLARVTTALTLRAHRLGVAAPTYDPSRNAAGAVPTANRR